jgi:putative redox protein
MSLAGCITTIWAIVARNSGIAYESFRVEVEADKPQGAKTLAAARVSAFVKSAAETDRLERVLEKTVKACPVGVLFEQAGVRVEHRLAKE